MPTYWRKLLSKEIATEDVPPSEWHARGVACGRDASFPAMRHAALLQGIDQFDADFWDIADGDARAMDPQERLLLRSIWHCVEQAGVSMQTLTQRRVGLFLALDAVDYATLPRQHGDAAAGAPILTSAGMIANRISYHCDFKGPSEAVDTACASTFVALRRAAQAIASGECEAAIVGGAKILLDPAGFADRDAGEILTRTPRMFPFDAQAEGYVRGEGVGCVLLKALDQAERDGDTVHAVIAGIGITHNGRRALSQVAPSVEGQRQAMREAYRCAGFGPEAVNYIEAHGTANSFSDASELAAFKLHFKESMSAEHYRQHRCAVSTVKANIGHLEGASGMASLIKAVLALREGTIAPIATWSKLHPSILLAGSPFHFPTEATPWERLPTAGGAPPPPRRVGLHSIGIGGVNAHVLLEEHPTAPRLAARAGAGGPQLVLLSARSRAALDAHFKRWHAHLAACVADERATLDELAAASRTGRDAMPYRAAFVADSIPVLMDLLARGADALATGPVESPGLFAAVGHAARKPTVATHAAPAAGPASGAGAGTGAGAGAGGMAARARAWLAGGAIDASWGSDAAPRRVAIPTYPFQERRVWWEPPGLPARAEGAATQPADPFDALFYETFVQPAERRTAPRVGTP